MNKTYSVGYWNRATNSSVKVEVEAINSYEACKKGARKLSVKMFKVSAREVISETRKDLFVCV